VQGDPSGAEVKQKLALGVPHREIVDYWTRHENECGLGVDWAERDRD